MLEYLKQFETLLGRTKIVKSSTMNNMYGHNLGLDSSQLSSGLDQTSMTSSEHESDQQQVLHLIVHQQAKPRKVVLSRELTAKRDLPFGILGGNEVGFPLFVSHVTNLISNDPTILLKESDQLLEINNRSLVTISDETDHALGYRVCKSTNMQDAMALLRNNIHLTVTVKTNPFGYKYMLQELKNPESREIQEKLERRQREILEDANNLRDKEKQEDSKKKGKYVQGINGV